MPAVDPARLRFQIAEVMTAFHEPVKYRQRLRDLFGRYANRALKLGENIPRETLMPIYHIPKPVTVFLEPALKSAALENPKAALALVDELWKDQYFEPRKTAIFILSILPLTEPEPILSRLYKWLTPELDAALTNALFSTGAKILQTRFPQAWEKLIQSLLEHEDQKMVAMGIRGLTETLKNPDFKNLPAVFRLISPFIQQPNQPFQNELVHLLNKLAERSPTETELYLQQALSISPTSDTSRLIKYVLPNFPESLQTNLKKALRKNK